jgi:hypothetical protein
MFTKYHLHLLAEPNTHYCVFDSLEDALHDMMSRCGEGLSRGELVLERSGLGVVFAGREWDQFALITLVTAEKSSGDE